MTTTAENLSTDQQYQLVYQGITAVAARCDGAVDDDGVGFNGQDTKFGRRIAAVPFEDWTPDVKVEAARIANKYQAQIERYTGLVVTDLPVVQQARELNTLASARNDARGFEALANRIATVSADNVRLSFPYDSNVVSAVRALPGRKWDPAAKVWNAPHSQALVDFIEAHRFTVQGGEIVVPEPTPAVEATAAAPVEKPAAVTLEGNRVRIAFDYDPTLVAEVRNLPGRQYDGSTKTNTADLHLDVTAFADRHGLKVADEVRAALADVAEEINAEQAEAELRRSVSNLADPAELPEAFVQEVLALCPKAVLV